MAIKITRLPSRFQPKDLVIVNLYKSGKIKNCRILTVHFTESKVKYDIEVMVGKDAEGPQVTRIYNVDSVYVEPAVIVDNVKIAKTNK